MSSASTPALFRPIQVGDVKLSHHVPGDLILEYYKQRARVPEYVPGHGVSAGERIAGWKKITEAVYAQGSHTFLQLTGSGPMARMNVFNPRDNAPYTDIEQYVDWYATAAFSAVLRTGFDGVEILGANSYLINQFLEDTGNKRINVYGCSIEIRARFALKVLDAVVEHIGQNGTELRLTPWGISHYTYLVSQLKEKYPDIVGPDLPFAVPSTDPNQTDFIYRVWSPGPVITICGYDRGSGLRIAEEIGQLAGYGRAFLANPDPPFRLQQDIVLNQLANLTTLYTRESSNGYTAFADEFLKSHGG